MEKRCSNNNLSQRLKVGIVWAGNPDHARDRRRSIPLKAFEPILSNPNIDFYSLQMGVAADQISNIETDLINISDGFNDFYDTACTLSDLDLVITVDTSMAHLAGALGAPTWVLLDRVPDWRWQLDREDTPWYPSLRLFRSKGDLDGVLDEVASALANLAC